VPLSAVLFIWGVSAVLGMILGGRFTDKLGPYRVIALALGILTAAFLGLYAIGVFVPPARSAVPVLAAVILWGSSVWGFIPAQQARLMAVGGVNVAPLVLSLNASFMYCGFSAGAALGGYTLARGTVFDIGWVGAALEFGALSLLWLASRRAATAVGSAAAAGR
jgi:predicted MFS family arabinose efflux permease